MRSAWSQAGSDTQALAVPTGPPRPAGDVWTPACLPRSLPPNGCKDPYVLMSIAVAPSQLLRGIAQLSPTPAALYVSTLQRHPPRVGVLLPMLPHCGFSCLPHPSLAPLFPACLTHLRGTGGSELVDVSTRLSSQHNGQDPPSATKWGTELHPYPHACWTCWHHPEHCLFPAWGQWPY